MTTKIEHINNAYSQLRISGLTVNPTPADVSTALERLEDMMAEFEDGRNLCVNYNFEENPDPGTESGVKRSINHMIATNLGVRLVPDFNKAVPQILFAQASQSYSSVSAIVAAQNIRQVQAPSTMPRGSGNTLRYNRWQRFNKSAELAPNDCSTNILGTGEINDYIESFADYLGTETIASYTITASNGLTIISDSNTDTAVSYRVQGEDTSTLGSYQTVLISITTSSGRIEDRTIDFEVS